MTGGGGTVFRLVFKYIDEHQETNPNQLIFFTDGCGAYPVIAEDAAGGLGVAPCGFVAVITEIVGGPVAMPETWTARFPDYAAKFGTDFAASLTKPTGKVDAEGNALVVWQDYVAGTDPTNPNDVFKATIAYDGDKPVVSYVPRLLEDEEAKRVYTIYGKVRLTDSVWTVVPPDRAEDCNFFKVSVRMKAHDAPPCRNVP